MLNVKDNKKRIKELEKQYGDYLLRVKTNALDTYMRAVQQVLAAPGSPVWITQLSQARCVASNINGNVATYELRGPRDVPVSMIFTYVQDGEWVDVFWDMQGFKIASGTAKKGFALNYLENMKQAHLKCEADLARNPPPMQTPPSTAKLCPKCSEALPPNAKFCNKCGQKIV